VTGEIKIQVLKDTIKKIHDLRQFNLPVIQKTIDEYEKADVDTVFIDQQKTQLQKVNSRINELEAKRNRIIKELIEKADI
jgi:hypothetical protein